MERAYGLEGFEVPFGKFADKVMKEFKLAGEGGRSSHYSISACVNMPALYLSRLQGFEENKPMREVDVVLRLTYGKKHLTFSHPFTFAEIEDKLEDWGHIEDAQDLIVKPESLRLVIGHQKKDYNYGKQADGQEFDGDKFVKKIFKKCQADSKAFSPRCVVDKTQGGGKGGK